MNTLAATINYATRGRVTFHEGKRYIVTPVVMLKPGVLSGSNGPLLYPADVVAEHPEQWDGIPVTLEHPRPPGSRAKEPAILERQGIGHIQGPFVEDEMLKGVAMIDTERLGRLNPALLARLEAGERLEVSTGLYPVLESADDGAEYRAVVKRIRADHLALLGDVPGACSLRDGCGLNTNSVSRTFLQDMRFLMNETRKPKPLALPSSYIEQQAQAEKPKPDAQPPRKDDDSGKRRPLPTILSYLTGEH